VTRQRSRAITSICSGFSVSLPDLTLVDDDPLLRRAADRLQGPVLVTGATGFVGANVVRALLDRGADVHVLVRPTSNVWRLQDVMSRLHVHVGDITDDERVERAFSLSRPRVVLHLSTPRGDDHEARRRIQDEVVLGAQTVARLVSKYSVERLIASGSSLEYGPSRIPLKEDTPLAPTTAHGLAKATAAMLLLQAATEISTVCVLRLFHVYGPWESLHRLLPSIVRAAHDNTPLALTVPGIRRDWVHVEDVVDAMVRATGGDGRAEVFNVGTGFEYSNEDVVDCFERTTGQRIERLTGAFPARVTDAAHRRADPSRAAEILGWVPRHDLAAGIRRTFEWWQAHPAVWSEPHGAPPVVC
jgi:nucleoside-diphosphate-sugar epimerase